MLDFIIQIIIFTIKSGFGKFQDIFTLNKNKFLLDINSLSWLSFARSRHKSPTADVRDSGRCLVQKETPQGNN